MPVSVIALLGSIHSGASARDKGASSWQPAIVHAKALMLVDPAKAEAEARSLASRLSTGDRSRSDRIGLGTALWLQAEADYRLGRIEAGWTAIQAARRTLREMPPETGLVANMLLTEGSLASARSDVSRALIDFQNAYKMFAFGKDRRNEAITLTLLASLYSDAKDYKVALRYLNQAIDTYSADIKIRAAMRNNQANIYQSMGDDKIAVSFYRLALNDVKNLDSPLFTTQFLGNMAESQIRLGAYREAKASIDQGLNILSTYSAPSLRTKLLAINAQVRFHSNDSEGAKRQVALAFAGVNPAKTPYAYRDSHQAAYLIAKATGDSADALVHLEALKRLDDQATALATDTSTALMAARFDFANQELKISNLRSDELRRTVAFEQARARTQHRMLLATAGTTVLIIAMLGIGLVTIRRSRDQVRAANADLAETNRALGDALAAKTAFLATTSHEIRTPLNGILGMTQVLLSDAALPIGVRERLDVVRGAGQTMKALVDDILDVAKMEAGKLTLETVPFDLRATLIDAAALWEDQAAAKGLAFETDLPGGPTMVVGDPARVRQIVFNLLSNALKFTARGTIGLYAESEGDSVRIAVSDTGVGIPVDKQRLVFESFRQADTSTTRRFGGTGLGLSICRSLAQAMDGAIAVDSVPDAGSTFTVTLPLQRHAGAESCSSLDAGADDVVLVLDRNPIMRGMWKALLAPHAPALAFAATVEEAIACLGAGPITRLLIDDATIRAGGPVIDGLAALASAARRSDARCWLLWPVSAPAERDELRATGIDHVIAKPVAGVAVVAALFGANADGSADVAACNADGLPCNHQRMNRRPA